MGSEDFCTLVNHMRVVMQVNVELTIGAGNSPFDREHIHLCIVSIGRYRVGYIYIYERGITAYIIRKDGIICNIWSQVASPFILRQCFRFDNSQSLLDACFILSAT